ncbi:MAG: DUF4349 domain-containing protein [Leptonema sp. (in: bacteria)]
MTNVFIFFLLIAFLFCSTTPKVERDDTLQKDAPSKSIVKSYPESSKNQDISLYSKEATQQVVNQQNITIQKQDQKRQIIYESNMDLQVKKIEEAIENLKVLTNSFKGYIEILEERKEENYSYLKIRIPIENFFSFLEELYKLGNVSRYSIYAEDISRKLQDVESRIETLKQLRNRLYELFKNAKKVEEKAKILKEINRLTTEIEELESRQEYLKDKATYSTIDLYLRTSESKDKPIFLNPPFVWIQNLNPLQRSIFNSTPGIFESLFGFYKKNTFANLLKKIKKPENFFDNKRNFLERDLYLFYSPLSVGIRFGLVPNEPFGDLEFWNIAIKQEFIKRNYELILEKKEKDIFTLNFKINDGIKIYYYTLQIFLIEEQIAVVEIFYPNELAYTQSSAKIGNLF